MASLIPEGALPVRINAFSTPASIWATEIARPEMSEERRELWKIEKLLSDASKKRDSFTGLEVDAMVAVRSQHDNRLWHRGKIETVMQQMSGYYYKVHLLDYGIALRAKPVHIRSLPTNCTELPPQALHLVLEGVVPADLKIAFNFDSLVKGAVCQDWTPASEKFVDDILRKYHEAFFVEGRSPQVDQTRFGDIFFILDSDVKPLSLKYLLCEHGHAVYSKEEFERRQEASQANMDGPELCRSPLHIESSTDASSCAPSPAVTMMSRDEIPQKKTLKIDEFLEAREKKLKKNSQSPTSPEAPPKSSDVTDHEENNVPKKINPIALLAKLRKSSDLNNDAPHNPQPPISPSNGLIEIPLEAVPKNLDSRFLPAGMIVKKEQKPKSRLTPDSSDFNDYRRGREPNHSPKSGTNYSSDTSASESTNRMPHNFKKSHDPRLSVHSKTSENSNNSDSSVSDGLNLPSINSRGVSSPGTPNSRGVSSPGTPNSSGVSSPGTPDSSDGNISDVGKKPSSNNRLSLLKRVAASMPVAPKAEEISVAPKPEEISVAPKPEEISVAPKAEVISVAPKAEVISESNSSPTPTPSAKLMDSSISMRDRILRPTPLVHISDDDTREQDYLARSVLLHGGLPPKPWMFYNALKSKFSPHIEQILISRHWCHNLLTIEKFMWPAIQQRQNVVMVSPKKSGKTSSYILPLMDFMIDFEQLPKGNGPLVLILCSGSKAVSHIHDECVKLVNGVKKAPRIQCASGLAVDERFFVRMLNGCEVFVTTPPCLLRILKEYKHSHALNLDRLQHYVLDEADVLMTRFLEQMREIQSLVVAEQEKRSENSDEKDPIQIVVASEKWEPHLLSFSTHLRGNPLLCINDPFEACVYGKPEVVFHLTQSQKKPSKLLQVLRDVAGLHKIVVFCEEAEMQLLEEFLRNECMSVLVVQTGTTLAQLQGMLHCWDTSKDGQHYIMLVSDNDFDDLKLQDATCVVHYSLPQKDKTYFVKRLSSIMLHIPNMLERKAHVTTPSIHLLMDETNAEQLPVTVQLMKRISSKLDDQLKVAAKSELERKEKETKVNKLFCKNLKMFGHCWKDDCPNRHVYISDLDATDHLPSSGVVSLQILHVHSAGHFSVRLKHIIDGDEKIEWPSKILKLAILMCNHFSQESNKVLIEEIIPGDLYAMEGVEGLFERVQVLEVVERNKHGNPTKVLLKFIDKGNLSSEKVYMLYPLPEHLKAYPAQAVDVFICGLLPGDLDDDYCKDATNCVKNWLKKDCDDKQNMLWGKIVMNMTGSLWVDPLNIMEWLPNSKTSVVKRNVKQSLLELQHAIENPQHLPKLFKLCGINDLNIPSVNAGVSVVKPKLQPKPDWAFLDSDVFEEVEFISADDVSAIFVRKTKFKPLLNKLMEDLEKEQPKRIDEEVATLTEGDYCLSRYKDCPKWYRVKILSKIDDKTYTVFYVDFGDRETVSMEELNCIPEWAITRLPFQAIECSLAGISACDSVDKLYDAADDKDLLAQVCERRNSAQHTGGRHYVVAFVDSSKPSGPSILNKNLLELDGVKACEDQLKYLDFEIDSELFNRVTSTNGDPPTSEENDLSENTFPDVDLSDLEFKEEDLSAFAEEDDDIKALGDFEVCNIDFLQEDFRRTAAKEIEAAQATIQSSLSQSVPASDANHQNVKLSPRGEKTLKVDEFYRKEEEEGKEPSDWEEEHDYVGRCILPTLCRARPPRTKWFEDLYFVWIKLCATGVENYFLQWTCNSMQFSLLVEGRYYHLDQQLRGVICPDSVQCSVKGFTVEVKMRKACSGVFWGRLFSVNRRYPWLSRDLEAAGPESSDSDCEVTLEAINREVKKMPVKKRRKRLTKDMKDRQLKPDMGSDSGNSNCEFDAMDSDEMF